MSFRFQDGERCREFMEELQEVAGWFSGEGITAEEFRQCVVVFECAKVKKAGFQLCSAVCPTGLVQFSLRVAGSQELYASMNIDPRTGESEVQYCC